ncbi:MAG: Tad domain-containing protein [Planctomycetaceae bacterium]|nr:Tad domain-containing protein [Planctomycetaceae bacterium]
MRTNKGTSNRNHIRRGIGLIWLVISFMALLAFMGLAIDSARVFFTGHQLQNSADAASLAGSRYVMDPNALDGSRARDIAIQFAASNEAARAPVDLNRNDGNAADGDIVIGRYRMQYAKDDDPSTIPFVPTMNTPNAMKVYARKLESGAANEPLPLLFGGIITNGTVTLSNIQKYATAMIYNASGAAVIALSTATPKVPSNKDDVGLYMHGGAVLNVSNDGSIYANTMETSAWLDGTPYIDAAEINLVGGINDESFDPTYQDETSTINTGMPPIEDPYIELSDAYSTTPKGAILNPDGTTTATTIIKQAGPAGSPTTYLPGYYAGGIIKPGAGQIVLQSGTYHLGNGINIANAQCEIIANGVTLHIVDGAVNINGADLTLSPPTSGDYAGVSMFQSRTNTDKALIVGNADLQLTGLLYFPNAALEIGGTGCIMGNQLIANTIEVRGNSLINVPYLGSPEIAKRSYLVE